MKETLRILYEKDPDLAVEVAASFGYKVEAKIDFKKRITSLLNVLVKIFNRLPSEKKEQFRDKAKEKVNSFSKIIKNISSSNVAPAIQEALKEAEEKNYLTKEKQDFPKIAALIRDKVHDILKSQKSKVKSELLKLDKQVTAGNTVTGSLLEKFKKFLVGASFTFVFGLIDNLGLFVGMEVMEDALMKMGYGAQVAAGLGNTFSDALGALAGGWISAMLYKFLKVKGEGTSTEQVTGVVIGCLIPVFIKMAIIAMSGGVGGSYEEI